MEGAAGHDPCPIDRSRPAGAQARRALGRGRTLSGMMILEVNGYSISIQFSYFSRPPAPPSPLLESLASAAPLLISSLSGILSVTFPSSSPVPIFFSSRVGLLILLGISNCGFSWIKDLLWRICSFFVWFALFVAVLVLHAFRLCQLMKSLKFLMLSLMIFCFTRMVVSEDAASKIKFRQNILEMGQQIMIYLCLIRSNLISRGTKLWEIEGEVYCQQ
ncbi:uncharacterized protein LOC119299587 [Triticum dicoccoides]|uniref:uncharacterized protein LOC119299587 n=1 Tax=Triticum dicoccoides TaxID=85692 RepID=UPI00188E217E|nr:uncharacterized protein LOC119299587 [Triticum dicoccoides]XP_044378791.1 uncharacterized protein LOC123101369 [Triticum aestivum]